MHKEPTEVETSTKTEQDRNRSSAPSPYDYYDAVRQEVAIQFSEGKISVNRTDVIPVSLTTNFDFGGRDDLRRNIFRQGNEREQQLVYLRHLALLLPLTNTSYYQASVDIISAALLAVHHWNNGINDIVPAIAKVTQHCPIKFTAEIHAAKRSSMEVARLMREQILPNLHRSEAEPQVREEEHQNIDPTKPSVTAILSGLPSVTTKPVSILASVYSLPVVSYSSQASEFDNKDQYPYLARSVTSNDVTAVMAAEFFKQIINSTHVGLIYSRDEDGLSFARSFQETANKLELRVSAASIGDPESDRSALRLLCEEWQLRHFATLLHEKAQLRVMKRAAEMNQGCTGNGTLWFTADSLSSFPRTVFKVGSPLVEALNGTATMSLAHTPAAMRGHKGYDAFVSDAYWPSGLRKDPEFALYVQQKLPSTYLEYGHTNITSLPFFDAPDLDVLMAYDSVMHIAMSACEAAKNGDKCDVPFDGNRFYQAFLRQPEYDGVLGLIRMDNITGSRVKGSLPYVVKNVLANDPVDGAVSFRATSVYIYEESPSQHGGEELSSVSPVWRQIDSETPFCFADGTTNPPASYPPVTLILQTMSCGTATVCASLIGFAMTASLFFLGWVLRYRKSHVVKASQPSFLIVLSFGAFLMGSAGVSYIAANYSSIHMMTFRVEDDFEQVSEPFWNAVCMSFPWMFFIGFVLSFSSLCTKLMRVNQIFLARDFRKKVVRETDVILPFAVLLLLDILVLTLWTIITPLEYALVDTGARDKYGRATELQPTCGSNGIESFYLMLLSMVLLLFLWGNREAYKARQIPSEYSESQYIAFSMASILQAFLIGVPIMFVARDFLNIALVITILDVVIILAILLPVFIPKMWYAHGSAGKSSFWLGPRL